MTRPLINTFHLLSNINYQAYFMAILIVVTCTFTNLFLYPYVDLSDLIMVYLLGLVVLSVSYSKTGPAILCSILCVLAMDYFFIQPRFSLTVARIGNLTTLLIMLLVAQIICQLTIHARKFQTRMETEKLRNILLSSISHDLRTPLTAIIGSATSISELNQEINNSDISQLSQNIYNEANNLNQFIQNVLQITRLESGTIELKKCLLH